MTNEDAASMMSRLKNSLAEYCGLNKNGIRAFDMAIKALEAQDATDTNVGGTISRQAAIEALECCDYMADVNIEDGAILLFKESVVEELMDLPSAQPETLSDAYTKAVWTWLLDYQIKVAELKGRYSPYEVLSWVAKDWRKEHERSD